MLSPSSSYVDPSFEIAIDPAQQLVTLLMRGLWSLETCARFDQRLRAMLPLLRICGCPVGAQDTLFDLLDFSVQQQASLTALGAMAADNSIGSRRTAIVTRSQLVKQQARRVAPDYGIFADRHTAMTWLFEGRGMVAA